MNKDGIYQKKVEKRGSLQYRIVTDGSKEELNKKVNVLRKQWDEEYNRRESYHKTNYPVKYAQELTTQAEKMQNDIDEILIKSINPIGLNFNELKNFSTFSLPSPKYPTLEEVKEEPQSTDERYNSKPFFLTRLSKKKMIMFVDENIKKYKHDHEVWEQEKERIEVNNKVKMQRYNDAYRNWENKRIKFEKEKEKYNQKIDLFHEQYKDGKIDAVERYFKLVLEKIEDPFVYYRKVDVEYIQDGKTILVDLNMPSIDDIPKLKSVKYVMSREEYKESYYTEAYLKKKYERIIYQIVLRTLNYVFTLGAKYLTIDNVIVNGKVWTLDKTTGNDIEPYILSVSVARKEFEEINLATIDPKAWFKKTKGISGSVLANVTPVAPILMMSRIDRRFVEGYAVADTLNGNVNLASMDWKDFENLIRELFEKEFSVIGGEVKLTQASRDGGVDAVAFDPDPIRGGKIIIQAKRYTNVVGVSAVRDLYGTLVNEGAIKGILVTTSYYGNDAYNFAQGKPITLLDGGNLLALLENHGYKAKIDIGEAKGKL